MNKHILVTGCHGFIGRHVARMYSAAGYTVTGLGHGTWDYLEYTDFGLTFWHTTDITVDALVTYGGKPDAIIHCAGSGSVAFSVQHPHQDFVRTVANTAAVLEFARLHAPQAVVVYPSSAAVYGAVDKLPIAELDPLHPVSPYGTHKLMAEELCQSYATNFGLSVSIVRFFSIYGKGLMKQLLWDACRKMTKGDYSFGGNGLEVRDWLHVDDASALLMAAAQNASSNCQIFNGGTGYGVKNADLLNLLKNSLGLDHDIQFSGIGRSGDPSKYLADVTRARALGWEPKIALNQGIAEYAAWFKGLRHS
jgi:UDP-glucose 4-epimerase